MTDQIERLQKRIESMEAECTKLATDEGSVVLQEYHGEYLLKFDRMEYEIDNLRSKSQDLEEKRKVIDDVRLSKELMTRQAEALGGMRVVKLKDSLIFVLIIFVLSLLIMEIYRIGVNGKGAEVELVLQEGRVVDVRVVNAGGGYEALEINTAGERPKQEAFFKPLLENGKLIEVEIILNGEGYTKNSNLSVIPDFSDKIHWTFWGLDTFCCCLFMLNFFFELKLSGNKRWYWRRNWIDFLTSIPFPPLHLISLGGESVNALRAGRIIRVIRVLRALRVLRMFFFFWRGLDHLSSVMDVKLLKRSLIYGLFSMFAGAMIFMSMERMEGGDGSFLESLWWSFTTLVTGGFADIHNPLTLGGKILTVMLVIGGMVLVGVFTATLTTVLVRDDETWQRHDIDEQFNQMAKLEEKVDGIADALQQLKEKSNPEKKSN